MDTSWDVVVLGDINMDYLGRAEHLPGPGQGIEGDLFLQAPGGKAGNVAVALARIGLRVALSGRIGRDAWGDQLLDSLAAEQVDTRYVVRDAEAATGVVLLHVDAQGEKQSLDVPGANRNFHMDDLPRAALQATRVVAFSMGIPPQAALAAARLGRQSGAQVVLDPAPASLVDDRLIAAASIIKPNDYETQVLTGMHPHDRGSARQAAQQLLARGAGAAAVQGGDQGNLIVWPQGEVWIPRLSVQAVDTTGSGDAFTAGIAAGLAQGMDWQEAGLLASAMAALASTAPGAQTALPTRAQLEEYLRGVSMKTS